MSLTKPYPRLWSLDAGIAMVVTDLHGDWDAYRRYRDRFVDLHAHNQADHLIITGDLIHSDYPSLDKSLEMVLDLLVLKANYGPAIIYLCGNHELPHIYSFILSKGKRNYTPAFEHAITNSGRRDEIIALFDSLPFYLRTKAGVSLTHAGASAATMHADNSKTLFNWSHQDTLTQTDTLFASEDIAALRNGYAKMAHASYNQLSQEYLAVSGSNDPRYNHLLRGFFVTNQSTFDTLLWPALFTRCEHEYGQTDYPIFLDALMKELSIEGETQNLLVTGHITVNRGHKTIAKRQLRLASAQHATPREAGQYLLFDTAQKVVTLEKLAQGLGTVYGR